MDMVIDYLVPFIVTFTLAGLKGFQHTNVIHNRMALILITSYAISIMEFAFVGVIIRYGNNAVWVSATGGALGIFLSVVISNHYQRRKVKA